MSKNTKANTELEELEVKTELDAHLDNADKLIAEVKGTTTEAPKADISGILAVIPDTFTPATLDKLFMFNDGGKTVRRHLRNHFAEAMEHNKKDKWSFTKAGNENIISYFAGKYNADLKALA